MERCAVLLRGINVGRGNRLPMADLRAVLEEVGCQDVSTWLQSGNAAVTADPRGLARRVERALPLDVRVVVFTGAELATAVEGCPWRERADAAPTQVHVSYLERMPSAAALDAVGLRHGDDEAVAGARVLYLSFTGASVDSPLAKALAKAELGVTVTTRNWTTALKLVEMTS